MIGTALTTSGRNRTIVLEAESLCLRIVRKLIVKILNSASEGLALLSEDSLGLGYSMGELTPKAVHRAHYLGNFSGEAYDANILVFRTYGVNLRRIEADEYYVQDASASWFW